jgi:putative addiction module antidote
MSDVKADHSVLEVTQIGTSLGIVLPNEILADLGVAPGDKLLLTRKSDGYRLTKSNPDFEKQMTLARDIMKKRFSVLRDLAT